MSKKDLIKIGQIYSRWTVLSYVVGERVQCKCECGELKTIKFYSLLDGSSKSCGCLQREIAAVNGRKILTTHGESKTRLFKTWAKIHQKCNNLKCTQYKYYGGKGITVCKEWSEFTTFKKWAMENGYTDKLTIDRINGNEDYNAGNCRWATMEVQNNNKSNNIFLTINGEEKTLANWCKHYGVDYKSAWGRYSRGKEIFKGVKINGII